MRKIIALSFVLLLALSCQKGTPTDPEKKPENFTELNIPSTFDWETAQNVICNFTSDAHTSKVYVYTTDITTPAATFYVGSGIDKITLNLPASTTSIKVSYEKDGGKSNPVTVEIANSTAVYAVPADSKNVDLPSPSSSNGAERADAMSLRNGINYPAMGMGTILFEDLWPFYGDYDFNDFVIKYNINIILQNKNTVKDFYVSVRVCALGGSLPYDLYLQLNKVTGGEIDKIELTDSKNSVKTPALSHLNNAGEFVKSPALLKFENIRENVNNTTGKFLNTSKGHEISKADLVYVTFHVTLRNAVSIAAIEPKSINFFIGKEEGNGLKEIHVGGQAPTESGKTLYETLKASSYQTNNSSKYYYSNTNLIWGIVIPEEIPHTYEKVPFLDAYTNFHKWAQSGGRTNLNWFVNIPENRVADKLVNYSN